MICWGNELIVAGPEQAHHGKTGQGPRLQECPEAAEWCRQLRGDMLLAMLTYTAGHLLLARSHSMNATAGLAAHGGIIPLLFLLGTLLLWRILRTLQDPISGRHPRSAGLAGTCLALTGLLAFSPGVWWLLLPG